MMPNDPVQFDQAMADKILRFGVIAADTEALRPRPVSRIRNPDGSAQPETGHEFTQRLVRAAILHLLEQGLLVIPDDAPARIERGIPVPL